LIMSVGYAKMIESRFRAPLSSKPLWEQPIRLRILWGESPLPSIARFRRLAYPGHREVTNCGVLGRKSHDCPVLLEVHGSAK